MQNLIENKPKIFSKNAIICLGAIGLVGFLIRLFYFPEELPITLDGALYFWYANDLAVSGTFPNNYDFPNNGWPTFLSIFFYFSDSENFLDYMNIQRSVTILISVATIIPIFILCRKFCGSGLSLLGASLFVFQPRIIENSLVGLTEPLSILLVLMCLVLFLQNSFKFRYLSFAFLALACLVRYENIVLIIPLLVLFILKYRKDKKNIPKYFLAISIFLLILLPMSFVRMDTMGYDGVASHSIAAVSGIGKDSTIYLGTISFMKSSILSVFPIFFAMLPLGFFAFFRNRSFDKYTILLFLIFMLIPIIYASSRNIAEPRYFFALFPIFSLISIYTVKEIIKKFNKTKLVYVIFVSAILLLSITYLDYNKIDYEYELDVYHVGLEISKRTSVINDLHPESRYFHNKIDVAQNLETFPVLSSEIKEKVKSIHTLKFNNNPLCGNCSNLGEEYNSLNDFINNAELQLTGESIKLTHIVADENETRPEYINDVFRNEEKFPYLTKIYDSSEHGYDYHVKIFRIDYTIFDKVT